MQQLILKNDVEQSKIDALLHFLRSWGIDAEVKTMTPKDVEKKNDFTLSAGIWKDYDMDAYELRKQAWNRNNRARR